MFRPLHETPKLDWAGLRRYLAKHGHSLDRDWEPRQFAGGLANLNFLIHLGGTPHVLRRPPFGDLPPGANNMAREHRVLSCLHEQFRLAPRSVHYCEDAGVLGAHFLIMEYRPGLTIGGELPTAWDSRRVGPLLSERMVRTLAELHAVDPGRAGLAHLGRPVGFLRRACDGWTERLLRVWPRDALVSDLTRWLDANIVPDGAPTLLHCDFKLDNLILDEASLQPRAVLDWDMATRGAPLFDVATLLSYWTEAGDPAPLQALGQMPTAQPGFWTRAQVLDAYARATGHDVSGFLFFRVLALFKLGTVFLQLHARHASGTVRDARYAGFGDLGRDILEYAHGVAGGRAH
ncbi:MAG TPA: phosphotransferase family protein [Ramlibacter sp.]|nr:phosphotransferase family protein [Ramlibacter sp.]